MELGKRIVVALSIALLLAGQGISQTPSELEEEIAEFIRRIDELEAERQQSLLIEDKLIGGISSAVVFFRAFDFLDFDFLFAAATDGDYGAALRQRWLRERHEAEYANVARVEATMEERKRVWDADQSLQNKYAYFQAAKAYKQLELGYLQTRRLFYDEIVGDAQIRVDAANSLVYIFTEVGSNLGGKINDFAAGLTHSIMTGNFTGLPAELAGFAKGLVAGLTVDFYTASLKSYLIDDFYLVQANKEVPRYVAEWWYSEYVLPEANESFIEGQVETYGKNLADNFRSQAAEKLRNRYKWDVRGPELMKDRKYLEGYMDRVNTQGKDAARKWGLQQADKGVKGRLLEAANDVPWKDLIDLATVAAASYKNTASELGRVTTASLQHRIISNYKEIIAHLDANRLLLKYDRANEENIVLPALKNNAEWDRLARAFDRAVTGDAVLAGGKYSKAEIRCSLEAWAKFAEEHGKGPMAALHLSAALARIEALRKAQPTGVATKVRVYFYDDADNSTAEGVWAKVGSTYGGKEFKEGMPDGGGNLEADIDDLAGCEQVGKIFVSAKYVDEKENEERVEEFSINRGRMNSLRMAVSTDEWSRRIRRLDDNSGWALEKLDELFKREGSDERVYPKYFSPGSVSALQSLFGPGRRVIKVVSDGKYLREWYAKTPGADVSARVVYISPNSVSGKTPTTKLTPADGNHPAYAGVIVFAGAPDRWEWYTAVATAALGNAMPGVGNKIREFFSKEVKSLGKFEESLAAVVSANSVAEAKTRTVGLAWPDRRRALKASISEFGGMIQAMGGHVDLYTLNYEYNRWARTLLREVVMKTGAFSAVLRPSWVPGFSMASAEATAAVGGRGVARLAPGAGGVVRWDPPEKNMPPVPLEISFSMSGTIEDGGSYRGSTSVPVYNIGAELQSIDPLDSPDKLSEVTDIGDVSISLSIEEEDLEEEMDEGADLEDVYSGPCVAEINRLRREIADGSWSSMQYSYISELENVVSRCQKAINEREGEYNRRRLGGGRASCIGIWSQSYADAGVASGATQLAWNSAPSAVYDAAAFSLTGATLQSIFGGLSKHRLLYRELIDDATLRSAARLGAAMTMIVEAADDAKAEYYRLGDQARRDFEAALALDNTAEVLGAVAAADEALGDFLRREDWGYGGLNQKSSINDKVSGQYQVIFYSGWSPDEMAFYPDNYAGQNDDWMKQVINAMSPEELKGLAAQMAAAAEHAEELQSRAGAARGKVREALSLLSDYEPAFASSSIPERAIEIAWEKRSLLGYQSVRTKLELAQKLEYEASYRESGFGSPVKGADKRLKAALETLDRLDKGLPAQVAMLKRHSNFVMTPSAPEPPGGIAVASVEPVTDPVLIGGDMELPLVPGRYELSGSVIAGRGHGAYISTTSVEVSIDGGSTWSAVSNLRMGEVQKEYSTTGARTEYRAEEEVKSFSHFAELALGQEMAIMFRAISRGGKPSAAVPDPAAVIRGVETTGPRVALDFSFPYPSDVNERSEVFLLDESFNSDGTVNIPLALETKLGAFSAPKDVDRIEYLLEGGEWREASRNITALGGAIHRLRPVPGRASFSLEYRSVPKSGKAGESSGPFTLLFSEAPRLVILGAIGDREITQDDLGPGGVYKVDLLVEGKDGIARAPNSIAGIDVSLDGGFNWQRAEWQANGMQIEASLRPSPGRENRIAFRSRLISGSAGDPTTPFTLKLDDPMIGLAASVRGLFEAYEREDHSGFMSRVAPSFRMNDKSGKAYSYGQVSESVYDDFRALDDLHFTVDLDAPLFYQRARTAKVIARWNLRSTIAQRGIEARFNSKTSTLIFDRGFDGTYRLSSLEGDRLFAFSNDITNTTELGSVSVDTNTKASETTTVGSSGELTTTGSDGTTTTIGSDGTVTYSTPTVTGFGNACAHNSSNAFTSLYRTTSTTSFKICGTNFVSGATADFGDAEITINGLSFGSATQLNFTSLTVNVPTAAGLKTLTVTNPDNQTATLSNSLNAKAPAITARTGSTLNESIGANKFSWDFSAGSQTGPSAATDDIYYDTDGTNITLRSGGTGVIGIVAGKSNLADVDQVPSSQTYSTTQAITIANIGTTVFAIVDPANTGAIMKITAVVSGSITFDSEHNTNAGDTNFNPN